MHTHQGWLTVQKGKAMCVLVRGWIGRLWLWCPQLVNQQPAQCSDARKMVVGFLFPALNLSSTITCLWVELTGVTKCVATIAAGQSSINTSFTFCLMYQSWMPSSYCRDSPHKTILEFRLQLVKELAYSELSPQARHGHFSHMVSKILFHKKINSTLM